MGFLNQNCWSWNLSWKRPLRSQELEQLNLLLTKLNGACLEQHHGDSKHQSIERNGKYSTVKSCNTLNDRIAYPDVSSFSPLLWKGMAPPKTDVFIWLLLHGRIYTRDFLVTRNLIDIELASCSFCDFDRETVEHLFLHCYETWKI